VQLERLPTHVSIPGAAKILIATAFGILLFAFWLFAALGVLSLLMAHVALYWPGEPPQILRSLSGPVLWATHHLAAIGILVFFLAWLRMRDWTRSMAASIAVLSTILLIAFVFASFFFFAPAYSGMIALWPKLTHQTVLSVVYRVTVFGLTLSAICSTWYAINKSKSSQWIFVASPIPAMVAFLLMAPSRYVSHILQTALPPTYPGIRSLLCVAAVMGIWIYCTRHVCRRVSKPGLADLSYWILGIMTHAVIWIQLAIAALAMMPLMSRLLASPTDMRWRHWTVAGIVSTEVLLALAILLTLHVQRRAPRGRSPSVGRVLENK
jgi:hypothetical protein